MTQLHFCIAKMRYHQKDSIDFCGEAVAQMILPLLGFSLPCQSALNTQAGGTQGLNPDQLCGLLNSGAAGTNGFTVRYDAPSEGVMRICAALRESGCAVPAAVVQGDHWVAVSGAVFDRDPAQSDAEILGFFVDNPEPQISGRSIEGSVLRVPPPHAPDDTCGYGLGLFGSANTFVTLHEWFSFQWKKGKNYGNGETWVTIPRDGGIPALSGSIARETTAPPPGAPMNADDLCRIAEEGIARYGLGQCGSPLAPMLARVTSYQALLGAAPIQKLPTFGSSEDYHVVTAFDESGSRASIRIGADGRFLSVQAPATVIPHKGQLHDLAVSALERYEDENGLSRQFSFGGRRAFTVHPNLVWGPCRQSMSPFHPFVQVNLAGTMLFVGMDGRLHPKLEPHVKPGRTASP